MERTKEDTFKVNKLLLLSKNLSNSTPQEAISYGMQAKDLAAKLNFKPGIAAALKNIGMAYYIQDNYIEALSYWKQSLNEFEAISDEVGVSNLLSNLGAIYFNQGDDAHALEYYLKSLKIAEKLGNKLRIATALVNIGAVYYNKPATHDKALQYYLKALPLSEALGDKDAIGVTTVNLGEIYLERGEDQLALYYFEKSLKAYENSENIPYSLNDIGKVYAKKGDYRTAIQYHQQAFAIAEKLDAKRDMSQSLLGIANVYRKQGEVKLALDAYKQAQSIAEAIHSNYDLKDIYKGLALSYASLSDYNNAFKYQSLLTDIKDTLYNIETDKKLATLLFDFEIQKKQGQIDLLTKDKALQELDLKRQKLVKNSLTAVLILIFFLAFITYRNYRIKAHTNKLLNRQKLEIEKLLLNILPADVAKELQRDGHATPRYYENVAVLFADFKSFTKLAETLSPQELIAELNDCFVAFDDIIDKYHLEKIKTIGDAYMCAGGIPVNDATHTINIIKASMEMQDYIKMKNEKRKEMKMATWDLRIGIHTGPVIAGVVGKKKYAYDIWGSTVNIANRMESNGEPGKVNISAATYDLIKDKYVCSYRGQISAKNIGEIEMYFVEQEITENVITNSLLVS